jgi:hypothetical protein
MPRKKCLKQLEAINCYKPKANSASCWSYYNRVIHKSVKHFKNSQQIDYTTNHGNSYADRERNSPRFFYVFHRCSIYPPLVIRQTCDNPSHSTRVSEYHGRRPYLLLLSPSGKSGQLCARAFPFKKLGKFLSLST